METTAPSTWKVGDLARASGLTVRTLHHYDEIGLLVPSCRTPAGHRLYGEGDVERLYRVIALRQLGFSLDRIAACLRAEVDPRAVVAEHVRQAERQVAAARRLHARLVAVRDALERREEPSATDFLDLIEEIRMTEETMKTYFTEEQLDRLAQRREQLGDEAIRAVEVEWPQLIGRAQAELDAGTDPADPKVQAIASRWDELLAAFHGGDDGIKTGLYRLWDEQGDRIRADFGGPSPEVFDYVDRARAARRA